MNHQKLLTVDKNVNEATTEDPPIVPLLTKYYPNCDPITGFVWRNWGILQRSSTTKDVSNCRLVIGYKRTKNVRDILVCAKFKKPLGSTTNKHVRKSCRYCDALITTGHITSTFTGWSYVAKKEVTCKSSNVI